MESEGIAGEVIFPNTVPPFFRTSVLICGNPSVKDFPLWLEGIRAHNRWLVDFCGGEFAARRAGVGQIFLNDIDHAIESTGSPDKKRFMDLAREQGLKAALAWREARFNGSAS